MPHSMVVRGCHSLLFNRVVAIYLLDKVTIVDIILWTNFKKRIRIGADSVTRNGLSVVRGMSKTPMTIIMVAAACDSHEIKVIVKIF